ncbi:hypothetical protein GUA87_10335 [Sneathiella sp. P13V-1]|uniref:sensor histidine kinase n=1 Tax=Sneathiella sp. P13V-1 TaxID=2697366 RepID=UPI00187B11B1|nr:ATP-binding protein [Sneathiella sp. P13V-1]MBE7637242.1 hypothetical protein [Sneathiella sp. P13V-1]
MKQDQIIQSQSYIRNSLRKLLIPLFVFFICAISLEIYTVWSISSKQDTLERDRSARLLQSVLNTELEKLNALAFDVAYWDDSVINVGLSLNEDWFHENSGDYAKENFNLSAIYLVELDPEHKTLLSSNGIVGGDLYTSFPGMEAELKRITRRDLSVEENNSDSFMLKHATSDKYYIVAAARISPDEQSITEELIKAYEGTNRFYIYIQEISPEFLKSIESRFGLQNLELGPRDLEYTSSKSAIPLIGGSGDVIGYICWQPSQAGKELLLKTLQSSSLIFVVMILVGFYIWARSINLLKVISGGIDNLSESQRIAKDYERAIRQLVDGEFIYRMSVNEALVKISSNASDTLGLDRICIWQYDDQSDEMKSICQFEKGESNAGKAINFKLGEFPTLAGLLEGDEPAIINMKLKNEEIETLQKRCMDEVYYQSIMVSPIVRHGMKVGVIFFSTLDADYEWTEEKQNFASSIKNIVSLIVEVHARNLIETELRMAKNKAEMANMAKSDFLANMSHELRTPLNAIIGFSDIMKQQIFGKLGSDQYVEYVGDINASAKHLLSLINDILDVAKTEAGTYKIYPVEVNLEEELSSTIRMVQGRFIDKAISTQFNLGEGAKTVVMDLKCFRQIALNILSNAAKFSGEKCNITIEAIRDRDYMTLKFTDDGIGIDPKKQKLVFDAFIQVENAMNKTHEGTGLGLAITRALVELHDGKISLNSTPGQGTTIEIVIPQEIAKSAEVSTIAV